MYIEVQSPAEALNQGDGTSTGSCVGKSGFVDQMRGQHSIDDAQDLAHDLRAAGEQEAQGKWKTQRCRSAMNE